MNISTIKKISIIFVFFLLLETFLFLKVSHSATILGTGTGALLGGDLTDPEDDGNDGTVSGSNFNWVSINASSKKNV